MLSTNVTCFFKNLSVIFKSFDVFRENELQEEEMHGLQATKARMKLKISELEQTLKKYDMCL